MLGCLFFEAAIKLLFSPLFISRRLKKLETLDPYSLKKIDWKSIQSALSTHCATEQATEICLDLTPALNIEQIQQTWAELKDFSALCERGFSAPISQIPDISSSLSHVDKGQVLAPEDLLDIATILETTNKLKIFARDFSSNYPSLSKISSQLYDHDQLNKTIAKTITNKAKVSDHASPELKKIRFKISEYKTRIEQKIQKLLINPDITTHLQDLFFTIRNDRYVLPMKVASHGRIEGKVQDSSASEQTLFIEPSIINELNDQLMSHQVEERIEEHRILRQLSDEIRNNLDVLATNYKLIIQTDFMFAKAKYSEKIGGQAIGLLKVDGLNQPVIELFKAAHPVIQDQSPTQSISNDICLKKGQQSLILSGPNAGGKTVILKTIGLFQCMAKSGLFVPCDKKSSMVIFDELFVELGDAQDLSNQLSTFSGHMHKIKSIVERSHPKSLVLIDELASGTDAKIGMALAKSIILDLIDRSVCSVITTHFDSVKAMAYDNTQIRNASMQFDMMRMAPTFKMSVDIPGQSMGFELCEQIGLKESIIEKAKAEYGNDHSQFQTALDSLQEKHQELLEQTNQNQKLQRELENQKRAWQTNVEQLNQNKAKIIDSLDSKYQEKFSDLEGKFFNLKQNIKSAIKNNNPQELSNLKADLEGNLSAYHQASHDLHQENLKTKVLPGKETTFEELELKDLVYLVDYEMQGIISKKPATKNGKFEINAGNLSFFSKTKGIRKIKGAPAPPKKPKQKTLPSAENSPIKFVLPTSQNTVDVRGQNSDEATSKMWDFLEKCISKAENYSVVIHGHGSNVLKKAIRLELQEKQSVYRFSYRPGEDGEGGDGVTVIKFG